MMHRCSPVFYPALAVAMLSLSGCPTPGIIGVTEAQLSGVVRLPSQFVGHPSTGGAFVGHPSTGGAFVGYPSTGGAWRLLAIAEAPLANAVVTLTDLQGNPIPNQTTTADANGQYTLPHVPIGQPYLVQSQFQKASGETASVASLAAPHGAQQAVDLSAASTVVTQYGLQRGIVQGLAADTPNGAPGQTAFADAVGQVAQGLDEAALPSFTDQNAMADVAARLAARLPALEGIFRGAGAQNPTALVGSPAPAGTSPAPAVQPSQAAAATTATPPPSPAAVVTPRPTPQPTATPTPLPACVVPVPAAGGADLATAAGAGHYNLKLSQPDFFPWPEWARGNNLDVYLVGPDGMTKVHFGAVDLPVPVVAPPGVAYTVIYAPVGSILPAGEVGLGVQAAQPLTLPSGGTLVSPITVNLPAPDGASCAPLHWDVLHPAP